MKKNLNFYYRCLCLCALGLLGSLSPLLGQAIFKATPIDIAPREHHLLEEQVGEYTAFEFDHRALLDYIQEVGTDVSVTFELPNKHSFDLLIEPTDIAVSTKDSIRRARQMAGKCTNYLGNSYDEKGNKETCFLSLSRLYLEARIEKGEKIYHIQRLGAVLEKGMDNRYVLYERNNKKRNNDFECIVKDASPIVDTDCGASCILPDNYILFNEDEHDFEERDFQVFVVVDYSYYLVHKNYLENAYGDDCTQDDIKCSVIQTVSGMLCNVNASINEQIDLNVVYREELFHIFTEPDNFGSGPNILENVRNYSYNYGCQARDVIAYIHNEAGVAHGINQNDINSSTKPICAGKNKTVNSLDNTTLIHEFGHALGAPDLPSGPCDEDVLNDVCSNSNNNIAVMCGGSYDDFFTNYSKCLMYNNVIENTGKLETAVWPPCISCDQSYSIFTDKTEVFEDCGKRSLVKVTVRVQNDCLPLGELLIRVGYRTSEFQIEDFGDFDEEEGPQSPDPLLWDETYGLLVSVPLESTSFEAGELKTFSFTLRYVGNSLDVVLFPIRLFIDNNHLVNGVSINETNFREIDGTTPIYSSDISDLLWGDNGCGNIAFNYSLVGTLIVDQTPLCLENTYFKMHPGAEIIVQEGAELRVFNNSKIFGCDEMWRGIRVQEGGSIVVDNASIDDAVYGIYYEEDTEADLPTTITIEEAEFVNNHVSLYIPEVEEGLFHENLTINPIVKSTFRKTGSMHPPYSGIGPEPQPGETPYAGIVINHVPNLQLTYDDEGNQEATYIPNTFYGLANGIVANASNVLIDNTTFHDIAAGDCGQCPEEQGYGILATGEYGNYVLDVEGLGKEDVSLDNTTFLECRFPVKATNMNVNIRDCAIKNSLDGITLENSTHKQFDIRNNHIESFGRGIFSTNNIVLHGGANIINNDIFASGLANAVGIYLADNPFQQTGWNVNNNVVTVETAAAGIKVIGGFRTRLYKNFVLLNASDNEYYRGISLEASRKCNVECNEIRGPKNYVGNNLNARRTVGIYTASSIECKLTNNSVENTIYGLQFTGDCHPLAMKGNTMRYHKNGLLLGLPPASGDVLLGIQNHSGNIWAANDNPTGYIDFGAKHLSSDQEVLTESQFLIDIEENSAYFTTFPANNMNWFINNDDLGTTFNCEFSCCSIQEEYTDDSSHNFTELDDQIAQIDIKGDKFTEALQWEASMNLYLRLFRESELKNIPKEIEQALIRGAKTLPWEFADIAYDLDKSFIELEKQEAVYRSNQRALLGNLKNRKASTTEQRTMTASIIKEGVNLAKNEVLHKGAWRDAYAHSTRLRPTLLIAQNQQQFLQIFLASKLRVEEQFTSGEIEILQQIAEQCPLEGGKTVYLARAALAKTGEIYYNDEKLCQAAY